MPAQLIDWGLGFYFGQVRGGSGPMHPRFEASIWRFPEMGVPPNGWFVMEDPTKMDDFFITLFGWNTPYLF